MKKTQICTHRYWGIKVCGALYQTRVALAKSDAMKQKDISRGISQCKLCTDFVKFVYVYRSGIKKKLSFNQQSIQFESGDMIFLYTDGVTEAMNSQRKQYTSSRLQNFLDDTDDNISLEILLEIVRKDIKNHTGDAEQSDDITMLALRFRSDENGE